MKNPIFIYSFEILDRENFKKISKDILDILGKNSSYENQIIVGLYFENLKSIRLEVFPYIKNFCAQFNLGIIIFHIIPEHKLTYFLENIPLKFSCAFINVD